MEEEKKSNSSTETLEENDISKTETTEKTKMQNYEPDEKGGENNGLQKEEAEVNYNSQFNDVNCNIEKINAKIETLTNLINRLLNDKGFEDSDTVETERFSVTFD